MSQQVANLMLREVSAPETSLNKSKDNRQRQNNIYLNNEPPLSQKFKSNGPSLFQLIC